MNKKAHVSKIVEILDKNSSIAEGAKDNNKLFEGMANGIRQRILKHQKMDKIMDSSGNKKKIK